MRRVALGCYPTTRRPFGCMHLRRAGGGPQHMPMSMRGDARGRRAEGYTPPTVHVTHVPAHDGRYNAQTGMRGSKSHHAPCAFENLVIHKECRSQYVSHFAAFFIVARAKRSIVKSGFHIHMHVISRRRVVIHSQGVAWRRAGTRVRRARARTLARTTHGHTPHAPPAPPPST